MPEYKTEMDKTFSAFQFHKENKKHHKNLTEDRKPVFWADHMGLNGKNNSANHTDYDDHSDYDNNSDDYSDSYDYSNSHSDDHSHSHSENDTQH